MKNATATRIISSRFPVAAAGVYVVDDPLRLDLPLAVDKVGDRTVRRLEQGGALSFIVQNGLAIRVRCRVS